LSTSEDLKMEKRNSKIEMRVIAASDFVPLGFGNREWAHRKRLPKVAATNSDPERDAAWRRVGIGISQRDEAACEFEM
jgi:hypothetical protein